jgi:RIO kinase 1
MPMVLKRKRKREYYKEFKIFHGVFDENTMMVLYRLLNKNRISVESLIKEGKESVILSGKSKEGDWVAIKVYRIEACDFKSMWKYLVFDPRFQKAKKNKFAVVKLWCQREFRNLNVADAAGVNCPKSYDFMDNVLITSFIGDGKDFAPMLIDIVPKNLEELYEEVLDNLRKLINAGLVHGDLSAYNILFWDKIYFIDFSHGTMINSPIALDLLKRDIKNVNSYFSKLGINTDTEKIYKELEQVIKEKVVK